MLKTFSLANLKLQCSAKIYWRFYSGGTIPGIPKGPLPRVQYLDYKWGSIHIKAGHNIRYGKILHVSKSQLFSLIWIIIVLIYKIWETSRNNYWKSILFQKLFWSSTAQINCSSDLKLFTNSQASASNFNIFLNH